MVVQVAKDWKHLLPRLFIDSVIIRKDEIHRGIWEEKDRTFEVIELACWGHDLIEDARKSYNDCEENLQVGNYLQSTVADIIYACTNEKGKNRSERGNAKYYKGIRETRGALYVKLCDRIANVQYSKMTKSPMFEMYKKENPKFLRMMQYSPKHKYKPMFDYLINLFI